VVFGSGLIATSQMAREGIFLNLLGAAIISVVCYFTLA
jgi:sodium-dependent dicarboxylate transporter 2/3/5